MHVAVGRNLRGQRGKTHEIAAAVDDPLPGLDSLDDMEALLDLRVAPDGRVLSAELVPPIDEDTLPSELCAAVADRPCGP